MLEFHAPVGEIADRLRVSHYQNGVPRVMQFLSQHALFRAPAFTVDRFILFESLQGNEGPVYVPLAEYRLGVNAPG